MRTAARWHIALILWTTAAMGGLPSSGFAAADGMASPRIVGCRVGFGGVYKVGCWTPIWIDVDRGDAAGDWTVVVTASDSDGVTTTISVPVAPTGVGGTTLLYTRVGRLSSPIEVALRSDGRELDRFVVRPSAPSAAEATDRSTVDLPATAELLVAVGSADFGLADAFANRDAGSGQNVRKTVRLTRAADLPADWFGYEAVDLLILSAGDGALVRELAADGRLAAIREWVELGGRLVILCGGRSAQELLGDGGPLASLTPGRLVNVVHLPQTGPLENYSQSSVRIASRGAARDLSVPQLADVTGLIEVDGGQRPADLPLVIRAPRGLGEVTFAGLDFDEPPLADWPGRTAYLRRLLRPLTVPTEAARSPRNLVTSGFDDFSGALRQRLAQSFARVHPISFGLVVSLAIAYIVVLFPLDYLLVHRVLRRPRAAWITFPLILLLFSAGAVWLANSRDQASGPSVNQVELVDVDQTTGRARGTYWAAIYSPVARRYDLALDVRFPFDETVAEARTLLSWNGLPGAGIGGMSASGAGLGVVSDGYGCAQGNELQDVPILTAATKSVVARWTAPAGTLVAAQLTADGGMVVGSLTNQTGVTLQNARLLYGGWAYRLGDLAAGTRTDVDDEHLRMINLPTLVTGRAGGDGRDVERPVLQVDRTSTEQLLDVMMFHAAAGGEGYARWPLRHQSYCDLSRLLDLGRAVLVAEVSREGSRLIDRATGKPLGDSAGNTSLTVYRFVLPVERSND